MPPLTVGTAGRITVVDRFEIVRLGRTDDGVRLYGARNGDFVERETDLVMATSNLTVSPSLPTPSPDSSWLA